MSPYLASSSDPRLNHLLATLPPHDWARWLLVSQDRAHADRFVVTHEFLALMLGVRRVGVTLAAGALQRDALIDDHRGDPHVRDRSGLEAAACSCYANDRRAYAALLA